MSIVSLRVLSSSDHYCIDIVAPSGDHCVTETVAPSSDHYCIGIVVEASIVELIPATYPGCKALECGVKLVVFC